MKDYERHVLDELLWHTQDKTVSLCGVNIGMEFHFRDVGHAFMTLQRKKRLMVCPDCLKIILAVFGENVNTIDKSTTDMV